MSIIKIILYYEWVSFKRNQFQLILISCIFLLSLYAVFYGQSQIETQKDTIENVLKTEKSEFEQYQTSFKEELSSVSRKKKFQIASDPAFAWYRHGYHAVLHPHDYAGLSIGQRDLHPYYYRLTGMSLHYQLFENEIANPTKLHVGNLDLSFIFIYLFPLLIIAVCHDLFSKERESGVLPLLHIQPISIRKITLIRLLFYFSVITGLAILISIMGLVTSGNMLVKENNRESILWILNIILYNFFWFTLLFFIISFKMNSSFTAIASAGAWLLFLILIPAVLNVWSTTKYPINTTSLVEITRRTSLENEDDDNEKKETIAEFLKYEPNIKMNDSLLHVNLLPKAYAAFTSLKDRHHQKDVDNYIEKIQQRNQWIIDFQWINPAASMQETLSRIVKTDLTTFNQFHYAIVNFHKEIKDFYIPKLFLGKPIKLEDYKHLPTFKMDVNYTKSNSLISQVMLQITLTSILLFILGFVIIKK